MDSTQQLTTDKDEPKETTLKVSKQKEENEESEPSEASEEEKDEESDEDSYDRIHNRHEDIKESLYSMVSDLAGQYDCHHDFVYAVMKEVRFCLCRNERSCRM